MLETIKSQNVPDTHEMKMYRLEVACDNWIAAREQLFTLLFGGHHHDLPLQKVFSWYVSEIASSQDKLISGQCNSLEFLDAVAEVMTDCRTKFGRIVDEQAHTNPAIAQHFQSCEAAMRHVGKMLDECFAERTEMQKYIETLVLGRLVPATRDVVQKSCQLYRDSITESVHVELANRPVLAEAVSDEYLAKICLMQLVYTASIIFTHEQILANICHALIAATRFAPLKPEEKSTTAQS